MMPPYSSYKYENTVHLSYIKLFSQCWRDYMKIRTSVNLFLVTTLVIAVCGALAFSVMQAKSYIESNFYKSVPLMLDASCSELQKNLAIGLALSQNLA